ncbi:MAG: tripartite tricarboxylate transporter TctB family protein [Candidatus Methylomirabilia bacterium]
MRRADILFALLLLGAAGYTMWESTKLPIGWIRGMGPGGGAFPFYVAAIMALSSLIIIARAARGVSLAPFFVDPQGMRTVLKAAALITGTVAVVSLVGIYGATILLFLVYMRWLGRHRWPQTIAVGLLITSALFLFFEQFLVVPLPKGLLEPLFY